MHHDPSSKSSAKEKGWECRARMNMDDVRIFPSQDIKSDATVPSGVISYRLYGQMIIQNGTIFDSSSTNKVNSGSAFRKGESHIIRGYAYSSRSLAWERLVDEHAGLHLGTTRPLVPTRVSSIIFDCSTELHEKLSQSGRSWTGPKSRKLRLLPACRVETIYIPAVRLLY